MTMYRKALLRLLAALWKPDERTLLRSYLGGTCYEVRHLGLLMFGVCCGRWRGGPVKSAYTGIPAHHRVTLFWALSQFAKRNNVNTHLGRATAYCTDFGACLVFKGSTVLTLPPAGHSILLEMGGKADDGVGRKALWDLVEEGFPQPECSVY